MSTIQINLIAAPHFVVTTSTMDKDNGLASVRNALDVVKDAIEKQGGKFALKEDVRFQCCSTHYLYFQIRVVSDMDEAELKRRLELAELEGDEEDNSDEDEEESGDEVCIVSKSILYLSGVYGRSKRS